MLLWLYRYNTAGNTEQTTMKLESVLNCATKGGKHGLRAVATTRQFVCRPSAHSGSIGKQLTSLQQLLTIWPLSTSDPVLCLKLGL